MGINGLSDLLRKYCPKIFKTKNLSEYAYKKVAIDTTLYLFKYKSVFGDRWLTGFISLIACLRKNDIHCVFIEDGKAPAEKSGERKKRAEQKEKLVNKIADIEDAINKYHTTGEVEIILQEICEKAKSDSDEKVVKLLGNKKSVFNIHICNLYLAKIKSQNIKLSPEDFKIVEELFKILGVPYYKSPSEAETFCCYLASHGVVDYVLSEDSDVLAYGTPYFLTKINTKDETVVEIDFQELISELDMTGESFRDLCIMCGNDYNDNIKGILYKIGVLEKADINKFIKNG